MAEKILVGCRLPHGLNIKFKSGRSVTLKGKFAGGGEFGITEVDAAEFKEWSADNAHMRALQNGAIFVAPTLNDLKAVHDEVKDEKTGLEPMPMEGNGIQISEESPPVKKKSTRKKAAEE